MALRAHVLRPTSGATTRAAVAGGLTHPAWPVHRCWAGSPGRIRLRPWWRGFRGVLRVTPLQFWESYPSGSERGRAL